MESVPLFKGLSTQCKAQIHVSQEQVKNRSRNMPSMEPDKYSFWSPLIKSYGTI